MNLLVLQVFSEPACRKPMLMNTKKKAALFTLGCKLNYAETETIERQFRERGFTVVPFNEGADVYVINTCSVTSQADKKCRNIIQKAIRQSPDSFVAVVGCYSQLQSEKLAKIPGVDIVLGTKEKLRIFDYVNEFEKKAEAEVYSCNISGVREFDPSFSVSGRTRSFVKIQDGCDYFCSYCTIPLARGRSRSNTIEKVIQDAMDVAGRGAREVVLTGVNIGDFGKGADQKIIDLMRELDAIGQIDRFRISSIEPNLLTDELINFVAGSERFVPHFHIPLQSGCDKILDLMNRKYRREVFADRVLRIKSVLPDAGVGADVIVGFPGESAGDFEDTLSFIRDLPVSFLHVFSYSDRPNTKAEKMPGKVSPNERERRSKVLHELADVKMKEFFLSQKGKNDKVLFESRHKSGLFYGHTGNYIRVGAASNNELINQLVPVELGEEIEPGVLRGHLVT
jgi:threonylcarbamoyladenosine tRNA methylthiotransferase MtaB